MPEYKIFSISECVNSVVDPLSKDTLKKGLTIKVKMDGSMPDYVSGDYDSFLQVISRLLRNAIRVTDFGEVSLSVDLENYNPNEPSNSLFFHVAIGDSGKNISNIDIPDLFLPFNRPGTENELSDNLDLDLAICRQLVERAGGGIWVEARGESTKGSVVHFSFKLAAVNVESGPPFSWKS